MLARAAQLLEAGLLDRVDLRLFAQFVPPDLTVFSFVSEKLRYKGSDAHQLWRGRLRVMLLERQSPATAAGALA